MQRQGSAVWQGGLKDGQGTVSTETGVLSNEQYSFRSRFEEGTGTNPEELIGAAHAGCFSMALAGVLQEKGFSPEQIDTRATVTLVPVDGKPTVTKVHLQVQASVPGASAEAFAEAAEEAKRGCPISRLLNAEITMNAALA